MQNDTTRACAAVGFCDAVQRVESGQWRPVEFTTEKSSTARHCWWHCICSSYTSDGSIWNWQDIHDGSDCTWNTSDARYTHSNLYTLQQVFNSWQLPCNIVYLKCFTCLFFPFLPSHYVYLCCLKKTHKRHNTFPGDWLARKNQLLTGCVQNDGLLSFHMNIAMFFLLISGLLLTIPCHRQFVWQILKTAFFQSASKSC